MDTARKLEILDLLLGWVGEHKDSTIKEVIDYCHLTPEEAEDCGFGFLYENETEITADDLGLTECEFLELKNNEDDWNTIEELYKEDPSCFYIYENAAAFGATDPDNGLREDETDEEWAEFLYDAYLNEGSFIFILRTGRYFIGRP